MKKKKILITSADLEIGGIERSLIGLLNVFDYSRYDVDLQLWRHSGLFMKFLPSGPNVLPQIPEYSTFQRPIFHVLREGYILITLARLRAKLSAHLYGKRKSLTEPGYITIQRSWRYSLPYLPTIPIRYDLAISFIGPHYPVTDKVSAKVKIGWIHTDYHNIPIDGTYEAAMWSKLDYIAAVSQDCRNAFLERFPQLAHKTMVIENIISPDFVRQQALEYEVKTEMRQEKGRIRLLCVGRFSYAKGIDDAVLACRKLVDKGYNIFWYVIGYGPDEALIRRLIREYKLESRFFILGKKTNPYPYMQECDIFVQPSRYEGKAVTVREAQILGKPVLITRFPTSGNQVTEGIDGHLCDLGVDGIVAGVCKLIDDPTYTARLAKSAAQRDYGNEEEVKKIYRFIEDDESN